MNIVRNIYCEGVFEGSYRLICTGKRYVWTIIESGEDYLRLDIKKERDSITYSASYHYGRTIPFDEGDLNGDF